MKLKFQGKLLKFLCIFIMFLPYSIFGSNKKTTYTQDISHLKNYIQSHSPQQTENNITIELPVTIFEYIKSKKNDKNGELLLEYTPKKLSFTKLRIPIFERSSHTIDRLRLDFSPQKYKNLKLHVFALTLSKSYGNENFLEEKLSSFLISGVLKHSKQNYTYKTNLLKKIYDYKRLPLFAIKIGNHAQEDNHLEKEVIKQSNFKNISKRKLNNNHQSGVGLKLDDLLE